ncbi:MAG: YbjN domain-containing protein [Chloroflexaceae bacterium]|jgi:hypothetical protein|nr:YbjN domain-containing protein [Chloroflexaceae bacterium]
MTHEQPERNIAITALIDRFLNSVGLENITTDEQGWRHFGMGSVAGRATAVELNETWYMRVEAHVLPLPADGDLIVPLMRELLELNHDLAYRGSFSLAGNDIFVVALLHADDATETTVGRYIHDALALADAADNRLSSKYGGTSKKRMPPVALPDSLPTNGNAFQTNVQSDTPAPTSSLFDRFNNPPPAAPPTPDPTPPPAAPTTPPEPQTSSLFDMFKKR